jgi:hypothetical protein
MNSVPGSRREGSAAWSNRSTTPVSFDSPGPLPDGGVRDDARRTPILLSASEVVELRSPPTPNRKRRKANSSLAYAC